MSEGTSASAYVLHPFRTLVPRFQNGEIGVKIGVDLRVETRGRIIKVRTYSIFELNYLHDMSKVFMLSIGINKKINWKQETNKIHKEYKVSTENKEFVVLGVVTSGVQQL